jgi:hypothetical protein
MPLNGLHQKNHDMLAGPVFVEGAEPGDVPADSSTANFSVVTFGVSTVAQKRSRHDASSVVSATEARGP